VVILEMVVLARALLVAVRVDQVVLAVAVRLELLVLAVAVAVVALAY
jgi:hypothetical protein